jgi:hypothetical protein
MNLPSPRPKVDLPVVECNFYAHRIAEGYYEEAGKAGAGLTAFDHDRGKDQPPLPGECAHLANITYFLKAVVPVAEQSRGLRFSAGVERAQLQVGRQSGNDLDAAGREITRA